MNKFIGFFIDIGRDGEERGVPVAAGLSKDETRDEAITRILGVGITYGGIQVQQRDDVSDATFTALQRDLALFFAERGMV